MNLGFAPPILFFGVYGSGIVVCLLGRIGGFWPVRMGEVLRSPRFLLLIF